MFPILLFFSSLFPLMLMPLIGSSFLSTLSGNLSTIIEFELFMFGSSSINFLVLIDFMSVIFLFTVSLISISVLSFSVSYMKLSSNNSKFHLLVITFIMSMFLLILSPNLVSIMIGWDGLGLSSYFLVVFYKSTKAFNAGLLTALSNRVGDALILISMMVLMSTSSFSIPFSSLLLPQLPLFLLIVASFTKSAQLPFSAWLPAAMAAPTPVSALVHSSTLVTAGAYLLIRLLPIVPPVMTQSVALVGATTMVMASLSAMVEMDMKKVVALSTLSQLGVMFSAFALQAPLIVFFHLVVHAFFKALLFVGVGNLIHNSNDYQDLRRAGGMVEPLPLTSSVVILSKSCLCGLPFFAAFFSKELIIEMLSSGGLSLPLVYFLMWTGVGLTALYSIRMIWFVLLCAPRSASVFAKSDKEMGVMFAVIFLFVPSFFSGKLISFFVYESLVTVVSSPINKFIILSVLGLSPVMMKLALDFNKPKGGASFYMWLVSNWSGKLNVEMFSSKIHSSSTLSNFSVSDFIFMKLIDLSAGSKKLPLFRVAPFFRQFFSILLIMVIIILF